MHRHGLITGLARSLQFAVRLEHADGKYPQSQPLVPMSPGVLG
jgi:hypothetical protein